MKNVAYLIPYKDLVWSLESCVGVASIENKEEMAHWPKLQGQWEINVFFISLELCTIKYGEKKRENYCKK